MILLVLKLNIAARIIVQVFCALFSTGGAAGLGFVVDYQLHDKGAPIRTRRFLYMVDASCGLLLGAATCMVIMIMISVYMM